MYGLLLDCIQKFLCEKYGEQCWEKIRRRAKLKHIWFVTHEVYGETVLPDLVEAASVELDVDRSMMMRMFGEYFARNIGHYGYARLLRVLGRSLREFLNGLDDLHEYLRFSYPNMSPPSFFCEDETEHGMVLHYNTKRSGFLQYVIGQLTAVGHIYGKGLEIELISEENMGQSMIHFTLELKFDNSELLDLRRMSPLEKNFSVDASTFLEVFPFCILFDEDLLMWREGAKLQEVLPDLVGNHLEDCFSIRKPMLATVSWRQICLHANCVFELVSLFEVVRKSFQSDSDTSHQSPPLPLRLKGQMLLLPQMKSIAFLCSPVIQSPEELYDNGIYVNDLSMHGSSRDVILAGSQRDPELNIALSQEKIRTAQLEESVQQTDRLLFQMIPKPIANQLRRGETPLNTCREFSSVSILFSDIVSFTPMCSRLHPMEVVCVLNALYVAYDELCEDHSVYKVETIGDAYMVICGAPVCTLRHAEHITDFALAIIEATSKINDPSTSQPLRIRVGIHSGNIVAGVVGSTILRYDVFGDTVNVAARMEATGAPMKIHISEATAKLLHGTAFTVEARGSVEVKGKGSMNTFWVTGKKSPETLQPASGHRKLPDRWAMSPHASGDGPFPQLSPQLSPRLARNSFRPSSVSPKPNEWPQAQEQLQKFPIEDVFGMSTTPPQARRNTVSAMPSHVSTPLDLGKPPRRLHDENRIPMPLSDVRSTLRKQGQLIERQASISLDLPGPAKYKPHFREQDMLGSELNLMHLRGSISVPFTSRGSISVPFTPRGSISVQDIAVQEMEEFAFHAEESAKQAKQLADWASDMVQRLKLTQVGNDTGLVMGKVMDGDGKTTAGGVTAGGEGTGGESTAGATAGVEGAGGATAGGEGTGGEGTGGGTAGGEGTGGATADGEATGGATADGEATGGDGEATGGEGTGGVTAATGGDGEATGGEGTGGVTADGAATGGDGEATGGEGTGGVTAGGEATGGEGTAGGEGTGGATADGEADVPGKSLGDGAEISCTT